MREDVTAQTYIDMNEEMKEDGVPLQILIPSEEALEEWRQNSVYYEEPDEYPNLVAEHWERFNKEREMRTFEEEQKEVLIQIHLDGIQKLLSGKITRKICKDHTGKTFNKIEIVYDESV